MSMPYYIPALVAVVLSIASMISAAYTGEQVVEVLNYPGAGIRVEYLKVFNAAGPKFTVTFSSLTPADGVSVDVFAWLPNGLIKRIGRFTGSGAAVVLNLARLRDLGYLWARTLSAMGVDPEDIGIGLTLLTTVVRPDGVYAIASVIPIKISSIIRGYSVRAVLSKDPIKVVSFEATKPLKENTQFPPEKAESSPLPPGEIEDGCVSSWWSRDCWYWEYEPGEGGKRVYVGFNIPIPLVATVIEGTAYFKVHDVFLDEFLVAKESESISVGIAAVAGVGGSGGEAGVSYEVVGYSWEAYSQNAANLNYYKVFLRGRDFQGPSILYVGFRGDISVAPYRLYHCSYGWGGVPISFCKPLDKWANITYVRPVNGGPLSNDIAVWGAVNYYDYGNPVVRTYLDLITYGWLDISNDKLREASDNVTVTSWLVKSELNTRPLFSGSFNALSLIMSRVTTAFAPIMSVSIGINAQNVRVEAMYLLANVVLESGEVVHWCYAKSPVTFEYEGSNYRMGMVYVRITG